MPIKAISSFGDGRSFVVAAQDDAMYLYCFSDSYEQLYLVMGLNEHKKSATVKVRLVSALPDYRIAAGDDGGLVRVWNPMSALPASPPCLDFPPNSVTDEPLFKDCRVLSSMLRDQEGQIAAIEAVPIDNNHE